MGTPLAPRRTTRQATAELSALVAGGAFTEGLLPAERELSELLGCTRHAVRISIEQLATEGRVRVDGRQWRVGVAQQALAHGAVIVLTDIQPAVHQGPGGYLERIPAGTLEAAQTWSLLRAKPVVCLPVLTLDVVLAARVIAERPSGVVISAPHTTPSAIRAVAEALQRAGVPVVAHGLVEDLPDIDTISSDHAAGCADIIGWLAQRGCKRILRQWHDPRSVGAWLVAREAGCQMACKKHGIELVQTPPRLAQLFADWGNDQVAFEGQVDAIAGVLAPIVTGERAPQAMLACNDRHAFLLSAAVQRFSNMRQVPLVCGYDAFWDKDPQQHIISAPAVTVDKLNLEVGRSLFALLAERLEGFSGPPRHRLIPPRLIPILEQ